jgi:HD-GYP domain-containing protein (c-di-GMP phosphodiesterase class II)
VTSDRPVETFGMAALLHDVGLYRLPEELRHEDLSKMTIEQQGVFKTHVGIGAQILSEMKSIHPAAIQGVEQHHARRGKQGFPSTVQAANLSLIGEITGMADDLAHLIQATGKKPDFDPLSEMEKRLHGFSPKVADAFRRAFVRRAKKAS